MKKCNEMTNQFLLWRYTSFNCAECPVKYSSNFSAIAQHRRKVHNDEYGYVCKECGAKFNSEQGLKYHLAVQPCGGEVIQSDDIVVNECACCGYKGKSRTDFSHHMLEVHDSNYPFMCKMCKKGFTRIDAVLLHARWDGQCRRRFLFSKTEDD